MLFEMRCIWCGVRLMELLLWCILVMVLLWLWDRSFLWFVRMICVRILMCLCWRLVMFWSWLL